MIAAIGCGCPAEANKNPCELCPGSLEDPTLIISDAGSTTCGDFVTATSIVSSDSEMCYKNEHVAFTECGCPYNAPPSAEGECTLCDGVPLPNPDAIINSDNPMGTCGGYEWQFSNFYVGGRECEAIRSIAGDFCGCPNPPALLCEVSCPENGAEFSLRKNIDTENDGIVLCGESLWLMSLKKETMCTEENKANLAAACCNLSQSSVPTDAPTEAPVNSPQDGAPDVSTFQDIKPAEPSSNPAAAPFAGFVVMTIAAVIGLNSLF